MNIQQIDRVWKACCYLSVGMIYLKDNALLGEKLKKEHIKDRLLGHWGASPAIAFAYVHISRLIKERNLNCIFIPGPGHGMAGFLAGVYLEGSLMEHYPEFSLDEWGMTNLFRAFSFPGKLGSHCTPEIPGSIQEGGELGYSLSHAYGTVFDNPDLITVAMVGDGEAETGPLAAAWHSNKFLNPAKSGVVLPILSLNGYKINNPTIFARIEDEELIYLFKGYGYEPKIVDGAENSEIHEKMYDALNWAIDRINEIWEESRNNGNLKRPVYPMLILRTPKGWTAPRKVEEHFVEGYWRSHQVPITNVKEDEKRLQILEDWLKSYNPQDLFSDFESLRTFFPHGEKRLGSNPHTNGGKLRKPLKLPHIEDHAVNLDAPFNVVYENTLPLGQFLSSVMDMNKDNFRVFGPDETHSNRLYHVFKHGKAWMGKVLPEDVDEGHLDPNGKTMEILSEHTIEGWLEGYLLTGRHGFLNTYEGFAPIIVSMVNQFGKWLDISSDVHWRAPISSLNILLTSVVWRQDHNGFTHQDPGFINAIVDKWPNIVRVYFPADANCLLATVKYCLDTTNRINVIVIDKQKHPQYLDINKAQQHIIKGISIWEFASNHPYEEPDVVIASCGDIPTKEAVSAALTLREIFPDVKIRFVNVHNLFRLTPSFEHPEGLTDQEFDAYFTTSKPIIFNFHGYPWLIHRLTYKRTNHKNLHVRGYRENRKIGIDATHLSSMLKGRGGITTPMQLAIINQIDRFSITMDVIDRLPQLKDKAGRLRDRLKEIQLDVLRHAYKYGIDEEKYNTVGIIEI